MTAPALSPAAQAALRLIEHNRTGTSFVEIVSAIEAAGIPTEGTLTLSLGSDSNIVLWDGVSDAVSDAVNELLTNGLAHLHSTTVMVYAADGAMLNLPIAQRPPAAGYKTPHWAPVVLNAGPSPDKAGKSKPRRR